MVENYIDPSYKMNHFDKVARLWVYLVNQTITFLVFFEDSMFNIVYRLYLKYQS